MLYDRSYMRIPTEYRAPIPGWKILLWVVGGLTVARALVAGWLGHPEVAAYLLPGREALEHWRVWTVFTYALVEMTPYWGVVSLLFLWIIGRMVEGELPRAQFLTLCAGCALTGAAVWVPLHWALPVDTTLPRDTLSSGCFVMVMGLMAYWCFTAPDEPVEIRLFFVLPMRVRPQVFFWFFLALDVVGFVTFELPRVLGSKAMVGSVDYSPYLGAMFAGWFCAWWQQRVLARTAFSAVPVEEVAPRKWLQKAMQVGAWTGGGRSAAAAGVVRTSKPVIGSRREMREEVDRILDKINVEGLAALSAEERRTLDEAKEWLGK